VKKRFTEEQIIGFLKQAEAGVGVKELCRKHGFSDASFYTWRAKFGELRAYRGPTDRNRRPTSGYIGQKRTFANFAERTGAAVRPRRRKRSVDGAIDLVPAGHVPKKRSFANLGEQPAARAWRSTRSFLSPITRRPTSGSHRSDDGLAPFVPGDARSPAGIAVKAPERSGCIDAHLRMSLCAAALMYICTSF
jgi:putative transposase